MNQLGKNIAAVALVLLGLAMLGFTGCGLLFGFALLVNDGWKSAWFGFVCAGIGSFILWLVSLAYKRLFPRTPVPGQTPAGKPAQGSDDSRQG